MKVLKSALLGLSSAVVLSTAAPAAELVCVNGDALMEQTRYAQELKKEVEARVAEIQRRIEEQTEQIREKLETLQKELESGLLSEEVKREKEQEFLRLQEELRRYQVQYQQEVQQYLQQEFLKFNELVKAALKALAQVEGFKAVVNCGDLLYYDPSIDITEEVAKTIDQLAEQAKKENP
ncbi:MAG: OmpH family outer membrane protein [Aquificae bacterium]|nr:OmpH family outer membrane protein [Aquificota bacterium]